MYLGRARNGRGKFRWAFLFFIFVVGVPSSGDVDGLVDEVEDLALPVSLLSLSFVRGALMSFFGGVTCFFFRHRGSGVGEVSVVDGVGGVRETRESNVEGENNVGGESSVARGVGGCVGVREV